MPSDSVLKNCFTLLCSLDHSQLFHSSRLEGQAPPFLKKLGDMIPARLSLSASSYQG